MTGKQCFFFGRGFDNNVVAGLPYFFFFFVSYQHRFPFDYLFYPVEFFFFFVSFAPGCMEGSVVVRACVRCKCGAVCVCVCANSRLYLFAFGFFFLFFLFSTY